MSTIAKWEILRFKSATQRDFAFTFLQLDSRLKVAETVFSGVSGHFFS